MTSFDDVIGNTWAYARQGIETQLTRCESLYKLDPDAEVINQCISELNDAKRKIEAFEVDQVVPIGKLVEPLKGEMTNYNFTNRLNIGDK